MLTIKEQSRKLAFYCCSSFIAILSAAFLLYAFFSGSEQAHLTPSRAIYYSVLFLTYGLSWLVVPFLIIRTIYFFVQMLKSGRKPGVGLFSIKFLFNPVNLLIFRSLLTPQGQTYRRRCLISFFLFLLMLGVMFLVAGAGE